MSVPPNSNMFLVCSSPRRDVVVEPFEEAVIDGLRREFADEIGVGDVLLNDFLDLPTEAVPRFHQEYRFRFFHYPSFPAISAGDRKPVGANRQSLLEQSAADLSCFFRCIQGDVEDSHDHGRKASYFSLHAIKRFLE